MRSTHGKAQTSSFLRLIAIILFSSAIVAVLINSWKVRRRGNHIADAAFWGADWVAVVTNFDKDLDWTTRIPYSLGIKLAVYVKKGSRTCAMLPEEVLPHLAFCSEVPNAHGRDAHIVASFFTEFYDNLPRMTIFLQDDCPGDTCKILSLPATTPKELTAFTAQAETRPFESDTCLCNIAVETHFRKCATYRDLPVDLPDGPERCYGNAWFPISWLIDMGVPDRGLEKLTTLRWPTSGQFAVPAGAVRELPKVFWKMSVMLLDGTGPLPAFSKRMASLVMRSRAIDKSWNSFEWSKAFERCWFALLDKGHKDKVLLATKTTVPRKDVV